MYVERFRHEDNWQDIKDATMNTIGKSTGKYPNAAWKLKLMRAEHSPIRKMRFSWRWKERPYWVSVHFVRYKIGIEHFVTTQRSDRTDVPRDDLPQGSFVSHECDADAQAMISISRKRLCMSSSPETREAWMLVKEEVEPALAQCMVRECVYRGFCPEITGCGFDKTDAYKAALAGYHKTPI